MADYKITKWERVFFIDDGEKRGPMTISQVVFHPTERRLIAACTDRRVGIWDLDGAREKLKKGEFVVGQFACPHDVGWVRSCDVHPSGQTVATGGSDRQLKLWKWSNGMPESKPSAQVSAHNGWVDALRYSPNGKWIATAGADRLVKIWDAESLQLVKALSGHKNYIRDVGWTSDSQRLVSGAEDGALLVWSAANWELQRTISFGDANEQFGQDPNLSGVHRLSLSRDDRWLASAGGKRTTLFDLDSGEPVAGIKADVQVALSPTANLLVVGSNTAKVFEYDDSKFTAPAKDKNGNQPRPETMAGRELSSIKVGDFSLGLCLSRDGKLIAFGKADGTVEVWEVAVS